MKKKFVLEVLDPTGNLVKRHHFLYEQGRANKIRITIDDKTFFWENQEGLEFEPVFPKSADEVWATEFKPKIVLDNSGSKPPVYHNPETNKTQKLFDESTLIPVWNVRYEDPTRGNKGEAVYYTVSAKDEQEAKTLALACNDFNKHILPEHYDARYLTAYRPEGNYKIGEVQYFEGDPRL